MASSRRFATSITPPRSGSHRSLWTVLVTAFVALAGPLATAQPVTGDITTQRIVLQPGPNLVSLRVLPQGTDLATLFGPVADALRFVKSPGSNHLYAPAVGETSLTTWDWRKAYTVYASAPAVLDVLGPEILPAETPLALAAGNNVVSYLAAEPQPVEVALASVAPHLVQVRDAQGRTYPQTEGAPLLTTMIPGQGYTVRLSAPATLTYPDPAATSGDGPVVVPTLVAALALTDLEPGQIIEVGGYYADGDGGGGTFRVTNGGEVPDGGTIFAPLAAQSAEISELWSFNNDTYALQQVPAGQNVVFGSYRLDLLNPATGAVLMTIPGALLHGHRWQNRLALEKRMDVATNTINDRHRLLFNHFASTLGDGRAGQVRVQYRHTTSGLRLVRQNVGTVLNARWFGARTHTEDPAFNNQPVLAHMINVARDKNLAAPGSITDILLPNVGGQATVYEYFGPLALYEGLALRGAAGTEVVEATTSLSGVTHTLPDGTVTVNENTRYTVAGSEITYAYRPVRVRSDATTLRVKSGEALRFVRMFKDPSDPAYLPPDAYHMLDARITSIYGASNVAAFGLADLVLDGNYEGNAEGFTEDWLTFQEKETWMRNAPGWSGFVSTSHGNVAIPVGQQVSVRNAAVVGYGATSLLGHINNEWTGENVLVGNAVWNHGFYAASGAWTNLTFTGFAWTHAVWQRGTVSNLVYERGMEPPDYTYPHDSAPDLFNVRGGDGWDEANIQGVDGRATRTDGTVPDMSTTVNGFFADLRGSRLTAPFNGIGFDVQIRDGVVIASEERGIGSLYYRNGNNPRAIYPGNLVENATVFLPGAGAERAFGSAYLTQSAVRNLAFVSARSDAATAGAGSLGQFTATDASHASWQNDKTLVLDGVDLTNVTTHFMARVNILGGAVRPTQVFVLDSHVNNTTNTLFQGPAGTGVLSTLTNADTRLLPFYLRGSSFNIRGGYYNDLEIFFALAYFEDCTDRSSGRTSEATGTFTMPAAGNVALIPTSLLWEPHPTDGVVTVSSSTGVVASTAWTDASGAALGANKRGPFLRVQLASTVPAGTTLTWSAAVRPWPAGVEVPDLSDL